LAGEWAHHKFISKYDASLVADENGVKPKPVPADLWQIISEDFHNRKAQQVKRTRERFRRMTFNSPEEAESFYAARNAELESLGADPIKDSELKAYLLQAFEKGPYSNLVPVLRIVVDKFEDCL
jgi:hypothetical protein